MDEKRLLDAGRMITKGKYSSLEQLFVQVGETNIRILLGVGSTRVKTLRYNPERWKLREIFLLSSILNTEVDQLFKLIHTDYKNCTRFKICLEKNRKNPRPDRFFPNIDLSTFVKKHETAIKTAADN